VSIYPANWPRCPQCGDYAMDGHITCNRLECDEQFWRDVRTAEWRKSQGIFYGGDLEILLEADARRKVVRRA